MWFTRISIKNPVLATMMMVAFVVLGLFSYQRLRVDQFPDINFPVVVVTTEYPGATPEVVEVDISRKLEEQINTINGIKNLTSRSYEGASVVIVEFDLSIDPAQAAQDVRDKVAVVKPQFRKEIKEPRISRFDPADRPVISVAINAKEAADGKTSRSIREVTTLADQVIKKRIEKVRGVGAVTLVGGVKREIQVILKPAEQPHCLDDILTRAFFRVAQVDEDKSLVPIHCVAAGHDRHLRFLAGSRPRRLGQGSTTRALADRRHPKGGSQRCRDLWRRPPRGRGRGKRAGPSMAGLLDKSHPNHAACDHGQIDSALARLCD